MLFHRLEMENIGPFVGNSQIDFAELATAGLFLLEGPTGAGKSTILDAAVFALYGHVAGPHASQARIRSQHIDPTELSAVTLTFETSSGIYRIRRTPQYERPKKSGLGTTTAQASVKLWRLASPSTSDGELLSNRHGEVDDEIQRIIGLNRAQFLQTVILPQGEFASFLRARPEDRKALLQRLFDTDLFDKVTAELDLARRDAVAMRTTAREVVTRQFAALESTFDDNDSADLPATTEDWSHYFQDIEARIGTVANRQSAIDDQRTRRTTELTTLQEFHQQEQLYAETWQQYQQQLATQAELADQKDDRAMWEAQIDQFDRAQPHFSLFERSRIAAQSCRESAEALAQLAQAVGPPADPVRALADERARISELTRLADVESGLQRNRRILVDVATEWRATSEAIAASLHNVEQLPVKLNQLRESRDAAQAAVHELSAIEQLVGTWRERLAAAQAARATAETVTALRDQLDRELLMVESAQQRHADLVQRRIAGIAGELARSLIPNEECPVCGSLAHPRPARTEPDTPNSDEISEAAQHLADLLDSFEKLRQQYDSADKELVRLRAITDGYDVDKCEDELTKAAARRDAIGHATAKVESVEAAIRATIDEQEAAQRNHEQLIAQAHELKLSINSAEQAVAAAEAQLEQTSLTEDTVAAELAAAHRHLDLIETYAAALASHSRTEQESATLTREWETTRTQLGYRDDAEFIAVLDRRDEIDQLRHSAREYDAKRSTTESQLSRLGPICVREPATNDQLRETADRIEDLKRELRELDEEFGQGKAQVDSAKRRVLNLRQALTEQQQVEQATADAIRVAEIATASSPENLIHVPLSTYVLMERFRAVLIAANQRLQHMSNSRFSLEHTIELQGKGRKTGLGLTVIDNFTGHRRNAGDLSGGETFYTSLALALGLADVVVAENGGVDLGTLFIDEGFGMLDVDTLDNVLREIDNLRVGGRVVGIVSHVEELKQRISDRIEVRPVDAGKSTVRVNC